MNEIRDLLLRGDRVAALLALRRLASGGAFESTATSPEQTPPGADASREVWEEALRRLEQRGAFSRTTPASELATLVRATVAECVRDAIDAESRKFRQRDAGSSKSDASPANEFSPATAPLSAESLPADRGGASPGSARSAGSVAGSAPARIGNYVVVRELDSGGFGRVFQAVSDDDLRLPVAIKIMHEAGEDQVRRFVAERAILANLRHPNIARFESSGILDDGRPWIAMEFVEGLPLLRFCERERLSTEARLRLFQKICDAVNEAHKWGVIHLDIKPANIMVTLEGEPKLLDFGIAKITRSLDPTTRSTAGRGSLTYLYSSPEQLRNEPVSTASDVYNLGLVLYELLTGSRARQSAAKEIDAFIRDVLARDPEPPSKRVSILAAAHSIDQVLDAASSAAAPTAAPTSATTSATTSQGGASRLARRLRGDLDTIVLMAMRIEPSRRYASPKELAEDVGRHLEQLPIVARKNSIGYGLGMLLLRHRQLVTAALLVLTTTVAVSAAVWSERERRAQAKLDQYQSEIIAMEREAREARRETERARDRRLGWVRLDLEIDPEVRDLLVSRVGDERRLFDLLLKQSEADPERRIEAEQVSDLVEPELKLVGLQRRSRDPAQLAEAMQALDALDKRIARVPEGTLDEVGSLKLQARVLETRGELLGPRTPDGKRVFEQALAMRAKLVELRPSDTQSRYDYAKVLPRFCEAAIADKDGPAAIQYAEKMLEMREVILADERRLGDARVIDRRERDVALAYYWLTRASLAAADLSRAERSAIECQRIMAERFARADRRVPEAEVDLARAFDDRLTVALESGDDTTAAQASADAAKYALSAAVQSIENAPELQQTLDFLARRVHLLLSKGDEPSVRDAETFASAVIEELERADKANPRSTLRKIAAITDRFERLQLLKAAAQLAQAKTSDAMLAIADLGLNRSEPSQLEPSAARRAVWIVGLVKCRDAIERSRTDDARRWAAFTARAATITAARSPLEARICLGALAAIARETPGVIGDAENLQIAELRKAAGGEVPPQVRAVPAGPTGGPAAQAGEGS
jgi:serine/threonine protein kinase